MIASLTRMACMLAALSLAGCGNDVAQTGPLRAVGQVLAGAVPGRAAAPGLQSADQVRAATPPAALAALAGKQIRIATLVAPGAAPLASPLVETGRNGDVITYNTPDGVAVSLRQGVLIATRGLGRDLMSADTGALLAGLRGGGAAPVRVHRYLDGENREVLRSFACRLSRAGRTVTEACQGDGVQFENSYVLDGTGRIVASRQWVGPDARVIAIEPF